MQSDYQVCRQPDELVPHVTLNLATYIAAFAVLFLASTDPETGCPKTFLAFLSLCQ
jgi:hypothetical protein